MLNDLELALQYQPYMMFDENEPFEISAMGYTIFRSSSKSLSFPKRTITVNEKTQYVIEYAVWYDYDIEHLYELEHIWIYVDYHGEVVHAEGSFHGKYLNMLDPTTGDLVLEDKKHLLVYVQPGKHAFLPAANLIKLIPNWKEACKDTAGRDGVLVQDMFAASIKTNPELQEKVEQYIKEKYSFEPTLRFYKKILDTSVFMTWEELSKSIPGRVNNEINKIINYYKMK